MTTYDTCTQSRSIRPDYYLLLICVLGIVSVNTVIKWVYSVIVMHVHLALLCPWVLFLCIPVLMYCHHTFRYQMCYDNSTQFFHDPVCVLESFLLCRTITH